jgi:hypothetical protein
MKQTTFAVRPTCTRASARIGSGFLAEMDAVIPWDRLTALIAVVCAGQPVLGSTMTAGVHRVGLPRNGVWRSAPASKAGTQPLSVTRSPTNSSAQPLGLTDQGFFKGIN